MTIFIDTADIDSLKKFIHYKFCGGITTNPSLLSNILNLNYEIQLKQILKICKKKNKSLSLEVLTNYPNKILEEAKAIHKRYNYNKLFVKVPVSFDNLKVVDQLIDLKIKVNVTCVFTLAQSILCADMNVDYISIFYNRIRDLKNDPDLIINTLSKYIKKTNSKSKILAASIRSPLDVENCIRNGADIVTVPPKIFEQLFFSQGTINSINQFANDTKKIFKNN
jgi:transaldolase